jgi:hypothetical protein
VWTVLVARLAARGLGVGLRCLFGKGSGWAFGLALGGFEEADPLVHAGMQALIVLQLAIDQGQEFVNRRGHPTLVREARKLTRKGLWDYSAER